PEGRVFSLWLMSADRHRVMAMDFLSWMGKAVGWGVLKSNWFSLSLSGDKIQFQGRGLGHGVGMCQWGSKGRAEAGDDFREILQHYFPGTRLSQ
ncbi:MAG: SpoIID/LytB domain-containing protein, partial [Candidatus Binatia bacterium]